MTFLLISLFVCIQLQLPSLAFPGQLSASLKDTFHTWQSASALRQMCCFLPICDWPAADVPAVQAAWIYYTCQPHPQPHETSPSVVKELT